MLTKIIEFLNSSILPESLKTPGGHNDWPPVWLVLVSALTIYLITRADTSSEDDTQDEVEVDERDDDDLRGGTPCPQP